MSDSAERKQQTFMADVNFQVVSMNCNDYIDSVVNTVD